jgi:hypothetical protein
MIAATLAGPNYASPPNNDERSIEVFADLESAIVALLERHHSGGRTSQSYTLLDGDHCIALFPTFGEGTEFTCYTVGGMLAGRPTEEQVLDALTDVHSNVWTWKLTLVRADGKMTVTVRANRGE